MSADAHGKPGDIWTRELLMRQAFDDEKRRIEQATSPIHDALQAEYEARHRAESARNGYSALFKLVIFTALACVFLLLLWWAS